MARKKTNKFLSVFTIFFSSIKTYFLYLDQTAKYMLIPVLGQIISVLLIFTIVYLFNENTHNLAKIPFFAKSDDNLLTGLWIALAPFIWFLMHSVYRYCIAFSSLNTVFYTISPKKKAKDIDFKSCDRVIERRLFQYILLLVLVSVLCLIPPLWLVLCLSFQIFALENNTGCAKAIAGSFKLTMENMFYVIIMLILVFVFSYWFLPSLFVWALEKISFIDFAASKLDIFTRMLPVPYEQINSVLALFGGHIDSIIIAKMSAELIISFIIIGFTLPFRCCCFTELYRIFDKEQIKDISKEDEEIIRRASGRKSY